VEAFFRDLRIPALNLAVVAALGGGKHPGRHVEGGAYPEQIHGIRISADSA
jgi:hypothetical protein